MQAAYDKQLSSLRVELQSKASSTELGSVSATIMTRVGEMIQTMGEMFADKDSTLKKLNTLEKAVSELTIADEKPSRYDQSIAKRRTLIRY